MKVENHWRCGGTQCWVPACLVFPTIFETATFIFITISTSLLLTLLFILSTFRPHHPSNLVLQPSSSVATTTECRQIIAVLAPHLNPLAKFLSFLIVSGSILQFIKWVFFIFLFYFLLVWCEHYLFGSPLIKTIAIQLIFIFYFFGSSWFCMS